MLNEIMSEPQVDMPVANGVASGVAKMPRRDVRNALFNTPQPRAFKAGTRALSERMRRWRERRDQHIARPALGAAE